MLYWIHYTSESIWFYYNNNFFYQKKSSFDEKNTNCSWSLSKIAKLQAKCHSLNLGLQSFFAVYYLFFIQRNQGSARMNAIYIFVFFDCIGNKLTNNQKR